MNNIRVQSARCRVCLKTIMERFPDKYYFRISIFPSIIRKIVMLKIYRNSILKYNKMFLD